MWLGSRSSPRQRPWDEDGQALFSPAPELHAVRTRRDPKGTDACRAAFLLQPPASSPRPELETAPEPGGADIATTPAQDP